MPKTPPATRLVLLVTTAVFINDLDRRKLATAAPLIQDERHLSGTELGVLLSAFYIVSGCSDPGLFAIPQILAGPRPEARGSRLCRGDRLPMRGRTSPAK